MSDLKGIISKNPFGRRFVIPDIHGCCNSLMTLIEKIGLSKKDQLFFLGDYIDRGPDSKGVLDFILNLIEKGYEIYPLRGNHEQMLLDVAKFDPKGLKSHARSCNILSLLEGDGIKAIYHDFLKKLSYYFELDDFYLVHAGFNFNLDQPLDDQHAMMWIRKFQVNESWQNGKPIIHGHVPTSLKEIKAALSHKKLAIPLDNGCVYAGIREDQGNLICLNLDTFELIIQNSLDN